MRRAVWFVAGAGAGVYASVRARRAAQALSVEGLQDRAGAAVLGLRLLREEVARGRAEAEPVVRERLGVPRPGSTPTPQALAAAPNPAPDQPHQPSPHAPHAQEAGTD
ncbi:DUF6167 family protein [Nocardioides sp.]|uniref:DUF6167 family protein n=1 Tax=Nocardioides sp. TaxID=35761 RepID=UPI003513A32D